MLKWPIKNVFLHHVGSAFLWVMESLKTGSTHVMAKIPTGSFIFTLCHLSNSSSKRVLLPKNSSKTLGTSSCWYNFGKVPIHELWLPDRWSRLTGGLKSFFKMKIKVVRIRGHEFWARKSSRASKIPQTVDGNLWRNNCDPLPTKGWVGFEGCFSLHMQNLSHMAIPNCNRKLGKVFPVYAITMPLERIDSEEQLSVPRTKRNLLSQKGLEGVHRGGDDWGNIRRKSSSLN